MKFELVFILLLASINTYAFITVGNELNGCDHNSLSTAIDDANNTGEQEIRVTTDFTQGYNGVIGRSMVFKGGYDTCNDAINDNQSNNKSNWTSAIADTTVINIEDNTPANIEFVVVINGFNIFGGNNQNNLEAGGIHIIATTAANAQTLVYISNSDIFNNTGHQGGGIAVSGGSSNHVEIKNTNIYDNTSLTKGGGISCIQNGNVQILNNSSIHDNTAENGGGVGLNACIFTLSSGDVLPVGQMQKGIFNNTASVFGGGIDAQFSTAYLVGTEHYPASVSGNSSQWQGSGAKHTGGGIHLNHSNLIAFNSRIDSNSTSGYSAGIYAEFQSQLIMQRLSSSCWGDNTHCSSLSNNIATGGALSAIAGLTLFNNSTAEISKTIINGNKADFFSVFSVTKNSSLTVTDSIISQNSATNGQQTNSLVYTTDGTVNGNFLNFSYNTIVDNNAEYIFTMINPTNSNISLKIFNSIIKQPNSSIIFRDNPLSLVSMDCDIINNIATESFAGYNVGQISFDNPSFVNQASADYHLSSNSLAIDFCDNSQLPSNKDLSMRNRGVDKPSSQNFLGFYDLGAFEFFIENIFMNGFE